jgi:hypothetical protein
MKRILVSAGLAGLLGTMAISTAAFAGKEDRDYKSACGCGLAITIDEATVKNKDDYYLVKHIADSITDGAAGYCTDAASKKAVCQMKSLVLAKAAEATFTFKGGKGTATTDGQAHVSFDMMTRELDK